MTDENDGAAADTAPVSDEGKLVLEAMAHFAGKEPSPTVNVSEVAPATDVILGGAKGAETIETPEAAADPAPADEPSDETPPAEDIWANVPEPIRAARDALQAERDALRTKYDRQRGQTSALTKQLNALRSQQPAPKPAETAGNPFDSLDTALAKIRDEFPEIGENLSPFADAVKALRGDTETVKARVAARDEIDAEDAASAQEAILTDRIPDWSDRLSKAGQAFWDWVDGQPGWVRNVAEANRENITDGDSVADVLERFMDQASAGSPPQTAAAAAPRPKPDSRRERQLAGAAAPRPGNRTTVADQPASTHAALVNEAISAIWPKGR